MLLIDVAYCIQLCFQHLGQPSWLQTVITWAGFLTIFLWTVDLVLKVIAFSASNVFQNPSCRFEIVAMVFSWVSIIVNSFTTEDHFIPAGWLRIFRIFYEVYTVYHVLRGTGRLYGDRVWYIHMAMFHMVSMSLGLLFLLVVLCATFALSFVYLLGQMPIDGIVITEEQNFRTWPRSFTSTFLMATTDFWVQVLKRASFEEPFCSWSVHPPTCVSFGAREMINILPVLSWIFMVLVTAIVFDLGTMCRLRSEPSVKILEEYAKAYQRMENWDWVKKKGQRSVSREFFLKMWRFLGLSLTGNMLDVGLPNHLKATRHLKHLRNGEKPHPFIKWPLGKEVDHGNQVVTYDEGMHALASSICGITYVEALLLEMLVNALPNDDMPTCMYITMAHQQLTWGIERIGKITAGLEGLPSTTMSQMPPQLTGMEKPNGKIIPSTPHARGTASGSSDSQCNTKQDRRGQWRQQAAVPDLELLETEASSSVRSSRTGLSTILDSCLDSDSDLA